MVNDNMTIEIAKQDDNNGAVFYGMLTDTCGHSPIKFRFKVEADEEEDGNWTILSIETLDSMCREQVDYLASKSTMDAISQEIENMVFQNRVKWARAYQTR
jgi:hypothetical protein